MFQAALFCIRRRLLLIVAIFSCCAGYSQTPADISFETYTTKDGLSEMVSLSVFQDQRGFIWVGTQEGVDKFDGYTFKHYQHDVNNPFSRPYGWVMSISEDKDGNILTGDLSGNFSMLNRVDDKWISYTNPFVDSIIKRDKVSRNGLGAILSIAVHPKRNRIWMGTVRSGLMRFDPQTKSLAHYRVHPDSLQEYGN